MAGKIDLTYFLNESDTLIFNAFTHLRDIGKETKACSDSESNASSKIELVSQISGNGSVVSGSSVEESHFISNGSKLLNDTGELKTSKSEVSAVEYSDTLPYDSVILKVFRNVVTISKMFDSVQEDRRMWQAKNDEIVKDYIKLADCVLSSAVLKRRQENVNVAFMHIKEISEKAGRLKHALRFSDQNDGMKTDIQYHRYITDFFELATLLLKDLEEDLANFENCKPTEKRELASEEFYKRAHKLSKELHKSIDTIKEFKNVFFNDNKAV